MNRRQKAFVTGLEQGAAKPPADTSQFSGGGNWSRMAMDQMERSLGEMTGALNRAQEATYQGIVEGIVPIVVPIDRIRDELGTDRLAGDPGEDTESLDALVENIRTRGLRTPLRVRPEDPEWRPDREDPRDTTGQSFLLQSGRRRLEACRRLGRDPVVFLSFVDAEEVEFEDLKERFFENAVRKNLSAVEKLYSIGLIARTTSGSTQAQIAEIIGTSVSQVSRGVAVVASFDRLQEDLDLATATRDQIDAALKRYREEGREASPAALRKRQSRERASGDLPFKTRKLKKGRARLRLDADGQRVLTITDARLDDPMIDRVLAMLESPESP